VLFKRPDVDVLARQRAGVVAAGLVKNKIVAVDEKHDSVAMVGGRMRAQAVEAGKDDGLVENDAPRRRTLVAGVSRAGKYFKLEDDSLHSRIWRLDVSPRYALVLLPWC
jgi:hypothetical protein